jgi:hypothetical protein
MNAKINCFNIARQICEGACRLARGGGAVCSQGEDGAGLFSSCNWGDKFRVVTRAAFGEKAKAPGAVYHSGRSLGC